MEFTNNIMNNQFNNNDPKNRVGYNKKIPKKLIDRLTARLNSKTYWFVCIAYNFTLAIISAFYFDAYYYTRKYINDGDKFWEYYDKKNLSNKSVPLNAKLSAMICILTFSFNLMNLIVIGIYVQFGGVRNRLVFASKLFL